MERDCGKLGCGSDASLVLNGMRVVVTKSVSSHDMVKMGFSVKFIF